MFCSVCDAAFNAICVTGTLVVLIFVCDLCSSCIVSSFMGWKDGTILGWNVRYHLFFRIVFGTHGGAARLSSNWVAFVRCGAEVSLLSFAEDRKRQMASIAVAY